MGNLGKKILSAFIDIEENTNEESTKETTTATPNNTTYVSQDKSEKFNAYFNKLFQESNLPGPDYYEFRL